MSRCNPAWLASFLLIAAASGCQGNPGLDLQGTWRLPAEGERGEATFTIDNDDLDFRSVILRKNEDGSSSPSLAVHWKGFFGVDNQEDPADGKWLATMRVEEVTIEVLAENVARTFNKGKICDRTDWTVGSQQRLGGSRCGNIIGTAGLTATTVYTIVNVTDGKLSIGKPTPDHEGTEYEKRHVELQPTLFVKD